VEGPVPSPTFNLLLRYPARDGLEVVHLDLYRVRDPDELWELGWEEVGDDDEILLVEWPERAGSHLPSHRWEIELRIPPGATAIREVEVTRHGDPGPLPGFPMAVARDELS
jgi:tRNA threonylcarbamoyl adenosine modification protein YjeE